MIIKTITCHQSSNHGAMLQAYALLHYLRALGHDASVIDYRPPYLSLNHRIPPQYERWGIKQLYLLSKLPGDMGGWRRHRALLPFYNQYVKTTPQKYTSIEQLRANPPIADLYIAGSDQIWNTTFQNGKDAAFYLDFGSPNRKISYAASFATESLEHGTEEFVKKNLSNLDAISVRESSGLRILKELGYDGEMVVDPVFLLSKEQWDQFDSEVAANERYILTYDFDKKKSLIGHIAKRLAEASGCKVYSVSPFKRGYADKSFVDVGPDVFISLIKHAQCVICNSFHGTAFSMIYGKDFFVLNRKDGLNVRMRDLLMRYNLGYRLISENAPNSQLLSGIDYGAVYLQLERDIEASKQYLLRQIELAK
jgi:hypothetical protein